MYSLFTKAEARMPMGVKRPCGTGSVACGRQGCEQQAPALHVAAINARDPKGVPGF